MHGFNRKKRFKKIYRICSLFTAFFFLTNVIFPPSYVQAQVQAGIPRSVLNLPLPGNMVGLSLVFTPPLIRGIQLFPDDPLRFNFIIHRGDTKLGGDELKKEAEKLIKYFLSSLTVPEKDLWVNLSPYEDQRIIPKEFGTTEMGRDLLAQDYILKQITASLVYPEKELGKKFWDEVYQKAFEKFGVTNVPMNTFNKVWIVPDKAVVYEAADNAVYVLESHLKVMLDSDYTALKENLGKEKFGTDKVSESDAKDANAVSREVLKQIIIPAIEREVNEGKNFANLRQIVNSMILATWYKAALKDSLLGQVYADKNKVAGIDLEDKTVKDQIYQEYMKAFEKGVYDYIKEDYDPASKEIIPRKYFSGGFDSRYAAIIKMLNDGNLASLEEGRLKEILEEINELSKLLGQIESTTVFTVDVTEISHKNMGIDLNKKKELIEQLIKAKAKAAETEVPASENTESLSDFSLLSEIANKFKVKKDTLVTMETVQDIFDGLVDRQRPFKLQQGKGGRIDSFLSRINNYGEGLDHRPNEDFGPQDMREGKILLYWTPSGYDFTTYIYQTKIQFLNMMADLLNIDPNAARDLVRRGIILAGMEDAARAEAALLRIEAKGGAALAAKVRIIADGLKQRSRSQLSVSDRINDNIGNKIDQVLRKNIFYNEKNIAFRGLNEALSKESWKMDEVVRLYWRSSQRSYDTLRASTGYFIQIVADLYELDPQTADDLIKGLNIALINLVQREWVSFNKQDQAELMKGFENAGLLDLYTVKTGDTFKMIAAKNGMSVDRVLELNPGFKKEDDLIIGQVITVEIKDAVVGENILSEKAVLSKPMEDRLRKEIESYRERSKNVPMWRLEWKEFKLNVRSNPSIQGLQLAINFVMILENQIRSGNDKLSIEDKKAMDDIFVRVTQGMANQFSQVKEDGVSYGGVVIFKVSVSKKAVSINNVVLELTDEQEAILTLRRSLADLLEAELDQNVSKRKHFGQNVNDLNKQVREFMKKAFELKDVVASGRDTELIVRYAEAEKLIQLVAEKISANAYRYNAINRYEALAAIYIRINGMLAMHYNNTPLHLAVGNLDSIPDYVTLGNILKELLAGLMKVRADLEFPIKDVPSQIVEDYKGIAANRINTVALAIENYEKAFGEKAVVSIPVKKNETLADIAREYRMTAAEISDLNLGIDIYENLKPGRLIRIDLDGFGLVRAEGETLADIAKHNQMTNEKILLLNNELKLYQRFLPGDTVNILVNGIMEVAALRNETLRDIADQFQITEKKIMRFNPELKIDQKLKYGRPVNVPMGRVFRSKLESAEGEEESTTLADLAFEYDLTEEKILALNPGIKIDQELYTGDFIRLEQDSYTIDITKKQALQGATLEYIAEIYDMTNARILALNPGLKINEKLSKGRSISVDRYVKISPIRHWKGLTPEQKRKLMTDQEGPITKDKEYLMDTAKKYSDSLQKYLSLGPKVQDVSNAVLDGIVNLQIDLGLALKSGSSMDIESTVKNIYNFASENKVQKLQDLLEGRAVLDKDFSRLNEKDIQDIRVLVEKLKAAVATGDVNNAKRLSFDLNGLYTRLIHGLSEKYNNDSKDLWGNIEEEQKLEDLYNEYSEAYQLLSEDGTVEDGMAKLQSYHSEMYAFLREVREKYFSKLKKTMTREDYDNFKGFMDDFIRLFQVLSGEMDVDSTSEALNSGRTADVLNDHIDHLKKNGDEAMVLLLSKVQKKIELNEEEKQKATDYRILLEETKKDLEASSENSQAQIEDLGLLIDVIRKAVEGFRLDEYQRMVVEDIQKDIKVVDQLLSSTPDILPDIKRMVVTHKHDLERARSEIRLFLGNNPRISQKEADAFVSSVADKIIGPDWVANLQKAKFSDPIKLNGKKISFQYYWTGRPLTARYWDEKKEVWVEFEDELVRKIKIDFPDQKIIRIDPVVTGQRNNLFVYGIDGKAWSYRYDRRMGTEYLEADRMVGKQIAEMFYKKAEAKNDTTMRGAVINAAEEYLENLDYTIFNEDLPPEAIRKLEHFRSKLWLAVESFKKHQGNLQAVHFIHDYLKEDPVKDIMRAFAEQKERLVREKAEKYLGRLEEYEFSHKAMPDPMNDLIIDLGEAVKVSGSSADMKKAMRAIDQYLEENPIEDLQDLIKDFSRLTQREGDRSVKENEEFKKGGIDAPVGGIDLNPASLNLQINTPNGGIKRDGNGVALPMKFQNLQNINIDGFFPVIINIVPITSLPLLGALEKRGVTPYAGDQKDKPSSADLSHLRKPFIKEIDLILT